MKLLILLPFLLLACVSPSPAPPTELPVPFADMPGKPEVYRSIDAMTDCTELQDTFERNVYDSAGREQGTFLQRVTLSYATWAFNRMQYLNC